MRKVGSAITIFLTGAIKYSLIEIAFRGFTHWTMTITGGIIFSVLYRIHSNLKNIPLWEKCLLGSIIITAFEFTVGVIVNIILRWNVWDYSRVPFNLLGQVCLPFTALWFVICIPAYLLCFALKKKLNKTTISVIETQP